ncbi:hypothetical protein [Flavobacterium sp.]|uniref:hypothetical protein n=1 Tax=Flavobacterium sp. TaxID=239 RepID=UPI004047C755
MGKTSDSFKREIGKNTGKVVSNFLFGDKHSTPIRVSNGTSSKRAEYLKEKGKLEAERHEREILNETSRIVNNEINQIMRYPTPNNEDELISVLNELYIFITSKNWKSHFNGGTNDEKIDRLNNKSADAAFKKFNLLLKTLENRFPENLEISEFKKISSKLKYKRFFGKYKVLVLFALFFLIIGTLAVVTKK